MQHRAVLEAILAGEDGTDGLPSNILAAGHAILFGKKGRTGMSFSFEVHV
jgi:hypothetical protein